jgi:hypothetical protein
MRKKSDGIEEAKVLSFCITTASVDVEAIKF